MQVLYKPKVAISACLGFEKCRYNGEIFKDEFIDKLKAHVDFLPVCPETCIGLGVPREVIRIIKKENQLYLYQPTTGKDLTEAITSFCNHFLMELHQIEGFILKCKSPSCAYKDAKHYSGLEKGAHSTKGSGIFTQALLKQYPLHPFIDDGQLNDYKYREHFLIRLFLIAKLHWIMKSNSIDKLRRFHEENLLLLMCYSKQAYKELTTIVSTAESLSFDETCSLYINRLLKAVTKVSRYTSNVSMLKFAGSNISPSLQDKEKANIDDVIEKYAQGYVPFSVPLYVIKTYAIQYENGELLQQSIFNPFPSDIIELRDSGKARI